MPRAPRSLHDNVRHYLQEVDDGIHMATQKEWAGQAEVVDMHITNVVSLCDYGMEDRGLRMPIRDLCNHLMAKYSSSVFPALISHCHESQCTHTLFRTSTCVCTGAKSTQASLDSVTLLGHALNQYLHDHVRVQDFSVTNIVAACQLGCSIDMARLTARYQHSSGPPRSDVFPGFRVGVYKPRGADEWTDVVPRETINKDKGDKAVTYIVFMNGKVNVTGCNDENDLPEIDDKLKSIVDDFTL